MHVEEQNATNHSPRANSAGFPGPLSIKHLLKS